MKRRNGFVLVIALGLAASCGGTVETRSASGNVETDGGGTGGTNGASGSGGGRRSGSGGFVIGGSPAVAGTSPIGDGGSLVGSCNPAFCQPEGPARACCVTMNGPCGVDYGDGCAARGCSSPGGCITPLPLPTCTDGLLNGTETDVDCGGPACSPCAPGTRCIVDADCTSQWCAAGVCGLPSFDAGTAPGCDGSACTPIVDATPTPPEAKPVPTCSDAVKNGSETDVDCGGECGPCRVGAACIVADDCITRNCFGNHVCGTAECTDGMYNGIETDVDCGGSCARCPTGKHCLVYSDCASFVCAGATCFAPSCTDGVRNGNEVCVDCGGSCLPCSNCPSD